MISIILTAWIAITKETSVGTPMLAIESEPGGRAAFIASGTQAPSARHLKGKLVFKLR
jgi:hypothetical protein